MSKTAFKGAYCAILDLIYTTEKAAVTHKE